MEEHKEQINESKVEISTIESCLEQMLNQLEKGQEKGSTTHVPLLDNAWKWRKGEFNIWTGMANEGKAIPINTPIPTINGMINMEHIKVGDTVFDENGEPCNVVAMTDIMHNRKCYKISFIDNTSVVADAQHEWVFNRKSDGDNVLRTTEQLFNISKGEDISNYFVIIPGSPYDNKKSSFPLPVRNVEEVESVPVKCIQVDSPNNMYLCTESFIPTHNSMLIKNLALFKALEEDWRFLFCSPEDYPAHEFFDDMIHSITGKSTDKTNPRGTVSKEDYVKAAKRIEKNFKFVYLKPPDNTIKDVLDEFSFIIAKERVDAAIIDPLIKFTRPKSIDRDDLYASYVTSMLTDFARTNNISLHLVMHQLTPTVDERGYYPKPSAYRIKGGGTWMDGTDNILSVWRPKYAKDKLDPEVVVSSQKIKKQKLVGMPQDVTFKFDRMTNRYTDLEGRPIYDFNEQKRNIPYFLKSEDE